jgi:hypothetical protein
VSYGVDFWPLQHDTRLCCILCLGTWILHHHAQRNQGPTLTWHKL